MTKPTEHLQGIGKELLAKVCACLVTLCCLSLTLYVLFNELHLVNVTDSEGASHTMMTYVQDPQELMNLAGIVAEEHDDVHYTAYNGNLASLSI